jgi:translation initiation factor IF-2
MAKAKKDTQLFINGITHLILEGTEYSDSSDIVKNNKDLFIVGTEVKAKKAPKKKEVVEAPVEEIKLEEVVEAPKEELLIEEPVQALEVTEEVVEATEEETKPKRRRKK